MRGARIEVEVDLAAESCCECGITFAVPTDWQENMRRTHKPFWCPSGHAQHYPGKSDVEQLREQLKRSEARADALLAQADQERSEAKRQERRAAAYRGHATRLRRQALAGCCAFCNDTFPDLAEHMAAEHPDRAPEPSDDEAEAES